MIVLRRKCMLMWLNVRYGIEAALTAKVKQLEEDWARECWTVLELLRHVPKEVAERITVDREINKMDPDFSFHRAVFQKDA